MVARSDRRIILGLAAMQAADGVFNAIPTQWLKEDLAHLGIPWRLRPIFPVIKGASTVGLLAGLRWPRLGRLTARALVAYFVCAIGFHVRANDRPLRWTPAIAMLAWSARASGAYRG